MVAVKKVEGRIRDLQSTVLALNAEGYNVVHIQLPQQDPEKPWMEHTAKFKAWRRKSK